MAFLIKKDFEKHIQKDNLDQILGGNDYYLDQCILLAIAEATSYLSQRYYIEKIFNETNQPYDSNKQYKIYERIYANFPSWVNNITYTVNTNVSYNGFIYKKNNDMVGYTSGNLPTDITYWYPQYKNDTIYSTNFSSIPIFDYSQKYQINDIVKYYYSAFICKQTSLNIIPTPNNDYWDIYPSSFSSALPTDTLSWLEGDNRNEQLKACLIDIALYHLHSRINPRNIPELRKERYDGNSPEQKGGAIGWLKNVAHGLVNADLPERIDFQLPISWGSYEKQNNNF